MATCSEVFPAGSLAGQRRINGTRIPPSHSVLLRCLNGSLPERLSAALVLLYYNRCIFREAMSVERSEDPADALVSALQHANIVLTRGRRGIVRPLVQPKVTCLGGPRYRVAV